MPLLVDLPNSGALTATIAGPKQWTSPFEDVADALVFSQDFIQATAEFSPLALDTPDDTYPDCYLVAEGARDDRGGFVRWKRTYARIPPSRQVFESYSWTVPGIGSEAVYAAASISSVVNASGTTTITAAASVEASADDSVLVSYTFTDATTGTQYGRSVLRICLAGTSGTNVVVPLITEPGGTLTFISVQRVEPGRDPYTEEVGSLLQLDYFLPGVSTGIATVQDIPLLSPLDIYDNTGRRTTSFTAETVPTLATWRAQVAAGDYVCVVRSVPRRWMGNIYERATRYVKAI